MLCAQALNLRLLHHQSDTQPTTPIYHPIYAGDSNITHSEDERYQLCTTGGDHLWPGDVRMACVHRLGGHGRVSRLLLLRAGRHLRLGSTLTESHRR